MLQSNLLILERARIAANAAATHLPTVYGYREHAEAGGLSVATGAAIDTSVLAEMSDPVSYRRIQGSCHCGNIRVTVDWPDLGPTILVRACGCGLCTKQRPGHRIQTAGFLYRSPTTPGSHDIGSERRRRIFMFA